MCVWSSSFKTFPLLFVHIEYAIIYIIHLLWWDCCWMRNVNDLHSLVQTYSSICWKMQETHQHRVPRVIAARAMFSVCACVFVYAVRQGCVLCKSLAGASSQPGGQTRKQMDWFGLNPSHAILSSWPSSFPRPPSLPPHPTCSPRSAKWKQGSNRVLCCSRGEGSRVSCY